jgi:hypothetical protein
LQASPIPNVCMQANGSLFLCLALTMKSEPMP